MAQNKLDTHMKSDTSPPPIGLARHLAFTTLGAVVWMVLYSLLRLALLAHNSEQIGSTQAGDLREAFFNGLRFDLRLVVFACLPLLLAMLSPKLMAARRWMTVWLTLFAGATLFLGVVELDFYREFNQRLNGLVFQYMKEDPKTVLSMIWFGFPVLRYLLAWALAAWLMAHVFRRLDLLTRVPESPGHVGDRRVSDAWFVRVPILAVCLVVALVAARGTLRQGPPLRWGDAYTTDSMFANQLGLNATISLASAAMAKMSGHKDNIWKASIAQPEATAIVRRMLLTDGDTLVDEKQAAVRRDYMPPADKALPVRHVVFILMESFSGQHVGALGAAGDITPHFDKLAGEGVLFTRFFSNGTHTHQGMFASFACFPNLPGFEYLMQQQESSNNFSGLPQLLSARQYDNLYVYNGDFAWDNQSGFFGKQGVTNFIGRYDFVNPIVFDATWGVSDQDMFDRAAVELAKKSGEKPFYAMLQTLSNHTPYPLPAKLPVEAVKGRGSLDQHLTAMRYSDWALGQFFEKARKLPYYKDTLFVIVGDHGFASGEQLTEMHLSRFNVPLLLIAPGIREKFGSRRETVGTQVDIVPTIMGRLGGNTRHQCWGRDLLNLPQDDPGFGVIKPSGSDQTVALISGGRILVESKTKEVKLYDYQVGKDARAVVTRDEQASGELKKMLEAFVQTATQSLQDNTAGARAARNR
jgi:phosphoglycerol transferase MdoB-like AlkP superfamily enzyme